MSHCFWQLVVFLKFFQWCVLSFEEPKLPSSYTKNKFHCSLVSCANEAQASLALSRQRGKGAFHVSLQAGVPPHPTLQRGDLVGEDEEEGRRSSVEEDGVRVPVGHLRHVFKYVLFGDDSQQPPENRDRKAEQKWMTWSHSLIALSWKTRESDRKQKPSLRPGPLSRHSWFSFIKRSQGNWQSTATWKQSKQVTDQQHDSANTNQIYFQWCWWWVGWGGGQRNGSCPRHPAINCATLRGHLICCILATDDFQQMT